MKQNFGKWMTRVWLMGIACAWLACSEDSGSEAIFKSGSTNDAALMAAMIAQAQNVLDISGAGLASQGISSGRVASEDDSEEEDSEMEDRLCGAVVTKNITSVNNHPDSVVISGSITIDFGDGTQCADSARHKSGKITNEFMIVVNIKDHSVNHSRETVTLEAFTQDDKTINGQFISTLAEDGSRWLKIQDAQLFLHDSTNAVINWSGELIVNEDDGGTRRRDDDIKTVTGSITGTSALGSFSLEILDAITFKWACFHGENIPVSGMVVVTHGSEEATLDFGDGNCDKLYTSIQNGITTNLYF